MTTVFDNEITLKISEAEVDYLLTLLEEKIKWSGIRDVSKYFPIYEKIEEQARGQRLCDKREKENKCKDMVNTYTWKYGNGTIRGELNND